MDAVVRVESAEQMFRAVEDASCDADVVIMAAAVADYRPRRVAEQKIKKTDGPAVLELERTRDILAWLGAHRRDGQTLCGFSMETADLVANSRRKLTEKGVDLIVANDLSTPGAGFGVDTNVVTLITPDGQTRLPLASKREVADQVLTAGKSYRSKSLEAALNTQGTTPLRPAARNERTQARHRTGRRPARPPSPSSTPSRTSPTPRAPQRTQDQRRHHPHHRPDRHHLAQPHQRQPRPTPTDPPHDH